MRCEKNIWVEGENESGRERTSREKEKFRKDIVSDFEGVRWSYRERNEHYYFH